MKVTIDCPDNATCIGIFINYNTKKGLMTTNALIDCQRYGGIKINDEAETTLLEKE